MAKGKPRQVFQEIIRSKFNLHGWKELSVITGRSPETLRKWGAGNASPSVQVMSKVLRSLQLEPQLLELKVGDLHRIWKIKFLTYAALQDRYKDVGSDPFEVSLLVNITAVMLLRDLSVRGHALKLSTTEVGQPEFDALYTNQPFHGIKLRLFAKPDTGLVMYLAASTGPVTAPALVTIDNVDLLVEGVKNLKNKV